MLGFFDKNEAEIFKKIKLKSNNDLKVWNIANLIFPIFTIIISLLFFFFSVKSPSFLKDGFRQSTIKIFDFLLNGSIPLIGINLLVACSTFLIKFDKNKERKMGLVTGNLRLKLIIYSLISYLFLSALFAIENIYSPFNNLVKQILLFLFSMTGIVFSLNIANKLFLLQEEYINEGYAEKMHGKVDSLKNAIE